LVFLLVGRKLCTIHAPCVKLADQTDYAQIYPLSNLYLRLTLNTNIGNLPIDRRIKPLAPSLSSRTRGYCPSSGRTGGTHN
jgi:hypothetical protein